MIRVHIMVVLTIGLLWSFMPSIQSALGYLTLAPVTSQPAKEPSDSFSAARKIQLHFLKFRIYIPLEDIMFHPVESFANLERPMSTGWKNWFWCQENRAFLWVPLKFKIPIIGERVVLWCLNIPLA